MPLTYKVGDHVTNGLSPDHTEYDHGFVVEARATEYYAVRWEVAREEYVEDGLDLRPFVQRTALSRLVEWVEADPTRRMSSHRHTPRGRVPTTLVYVSQGTDPTRMASDNAYTMEEACAGVLHRLTLMRRLD